MTIWIIIVSAVAVCLLTAVFHFLPKLERTIVFFASITGAAAAVVSVVFAGLQLQAVALQQELSTQQQKNQVAFSYFDKWYAKDHIRAESIIQEFKNLTLEEKLKKLDADDASGDYSNYEKPITEVAALFEEMALAVKADYADEGVICSYLGDTVVRSWESLEDVIVKNRKFHGRSLLFENFEWLAKRWMHGCTGVLVGSALAKAKI